MVAFGKRRIAIEARVDGWNLRRVPSSTTHALNLRRSITDRVPEHVSFKRLGLKLLKPFKQAFVNDHEIPPYDAAYTYAPSLT